MDKTIVEITSHLEMVGFIKSNGTQCRFVSMVSETPVKVRAASPYKGALKVARKMGMVNINYVTAVQRRLAEKLGVKPSQVEYEEGKTWYKHLTTVDGKSLPLCVHATKETGEFYLQYYPTTSTHAYIMPDGTPVADADMNPWLYDRTLSDYKPAVIAVNVKNIKRLAASGVIMQSDDIDEAEKTLANLS